MSGTGILASAPGGRARIAALARSRILACSSAGMPGSLRSSGPLTVYGFCATVGGVGAACASADDETAASAAAKASRLERDIEAANKETAELRTQIEEAGKRNEELSGQLKQLEQDLKNTTTTLTKQNEQTKLCETHNGELYRISRELADWYTSKGAMNAILEAEPFTAMKRVEMENLLETYRDKIEGQHLERSMN